MSVRLSAAIDEQDAVFVEGLDRIADAPVGEAELGRGFWKLGWGLTSA
jgi:hypothetical protein